MAPLPAQSRQGRAVAHAAEQDPPWVARALWGALASAATFVVALARMLSPDPSGIGTHTQLGLPPCGFLFLTSLPCPACGLTTSFAHMSRFDLTGAVSAHPLGVPLFAVFVVAIPVALFACVRALPVVDTIERFHVQQATALIAAAAALTWVVRVAAVVLR